MRRLRSAWLAAMLAGLLAFSPGRPAAQTEKPPDSPKKEEDKPKEEVSVTTHTLTIGGQSIEYKATAGTLLLRREKDGKNEPVASIFYIAYEKLGEADKAKRPVMFSFNGGPGSSSVWMHLGLLGPKRVRMSDDGFAEAPPYGLIDNQYSILPQADLVFIDPVLTGFSRPVPGEDAKQFLGLEQDIRAVGDFIRIYCTREGRWRSPKYLIGESYGTTRAAGLSGYLQSDLGLNLNGIVLVSTVLNFGTLHYGVGNDLPYTLFLPSYAATAHYHKKLSPALQSRPLAQVLREAEAFADGAYDDALRRGDALPEAERAAVAARYAELTGLSAETVRQSNLRVPLSRFQKELLRSEGRTVGRFDGRYTGIDRENAGDNADYDPSFSAVQGPYTGAFNDYIRGELNFKSELPYEILTGRVWPWDFGSDNGYANVGETLRQAMATNPFLKIFVANGRYDLATPYYASVYTMNHLQLDASLRANIRIENYDAGHMMYLKLSELERMSGDLKEFLAEGRN